MHQSKPQFNNQKSRLLIWSLCLSCLFFVFYFLTPFSTAALMRSNDYEIQMPNLNFAAGFSTSTGYRVGITGGENAIGAYTSTGYRALIGFWYLKTIIPFSFSLSSQVIEFGSLSSGTPKTAATDIVVSAGGAGGYQVTAAETNPMRSDPTGATIPDTTGDNGNADETTADTWAFNTTYGFGYTMYGNDVPSPFPTGAPAGDQYKQFANLEASEAPQIIMSSSQVGKNRSSTLTYKINISAIQPAGRYHNTIIYVATPGY